MNHPIKTFFKTTFFWAAASLCLLSAAAHAQGVAMAVDRTGAVDITAGGKTTKLAVLDYLPPDAEVQLAAGASATLVYLSTSQEWQFTGPGRYRLQAAQPSVLQGAAPKARGVPAPSAQAMAKLEPAQRERLGQGAVVMRATGPLRVVSPGNADVLDLRPTLLWSVGETRSVRVSVYGEDSATRPVAQTVTTAQQWTVPKDLDPGDYRWTAELVTDPPEASGGPRSGRFRVIESDDARRARVAGAAPTEFAQRVARAMLLESVGLQHDALLLWRGLAAERPDEESLKQWAR